MFQARWATWQRGNTGTHFKKAGWASGGEVRLTGTLNVEPGSLGLLGLKEQYSFLKY